MIAGQPPKVFISYSWDDDNHRGWVQEFATRLRSDGIETILDRWHAVPGDQLPVFMERAVRESDFVLCVCTPKFRKKSDQREGGVGYEGDIMTGDVFLSRNQRKFIPVLRTGEWEESAPSWLRGKYYIDLRGDPYSANNYADLLKTLFDERESAPPIGQTPSSASAAVKDTSALEPANNVTVPTPTGPQEESFEFVNREIELATLNPADLPSTYWQCALINAPTGYGKSRLLERLLGKIEANEELKQKWNYRFVELSHCENTESATVYIWEQICGKKLPSSYTQAQAANELCTFVIEQMSAPMNGGPSRGVLLIIDSIEKLTPTSVEWLSSIIYEVVTGSYISYEKNSRAFPLRLILAGTNTETFWRNYKKWESSSVRRRSLKAPYVMDLSPLKKEHVEELIGRRAEKRRIPIDQDVISDLANRLLYLSGGHPGVINGILNELLDMRFRKYNDYLGDFREDLIKRYVSGVVQKILYQFPLPLAHRDIKTICVFRLIDLNTLSKLQANDLVTSQANISLLGVLCENKILKPPSAEKLFYHDDIIRRILYLDLAFGSGQDADHIRKTHECARKLYCEWIELKRDNHTVHHFFLEWLFHTLQIPDIAEDVLIEEWRSMLALIGAASLPLESIKLAINEMLEKDSDVQYLAWERFGWEKFSKLFE